MHIDYLRLVLQLLSLALQLYDFIAKHWSS
ncbi:hypothetical protein GGQ72_004580 [Rhizobium rhizoryzae]|uniref:Uncharacterized protein n=1 Tax=Rhizobium rhizoryzae TaxID=451876 RepID=A0A7W6LKE8_9HYPH|nr:hypothetical protein [Rhizobium rhizoryzae]